MCKNKICKFQYMDLFNLVFSLFYCRQLVASETRQLRTALNSFMDHLLLVSKTIDVFGSEFH